MSKPTVAFVLLAVVLSTGPAAMASFCSDFTSAIFCDDFDRYCDNPPPYPGVCGTDSGGENTAPLLAKWVHKSWNYNTNQKCGADIKVEDIDEIIPGPPYGGRIPNNGSEGGQVGQNAVNLASYINAKIPGQTLINGSDAQPLVLTFTMGALAYGLPFSNGYLELNLGDDGSGLVNNPTQAPTDFVMVGANDGTGCLQCNAMCTGGETSSTAAMPSICQQEFPNALCPPLQTFTRTALAIGCVPHLDNNPCHCAAPDSTVARVPQNYHLSYYDGLKWRPLREGIGGTGSNGDFILGDKFDTVVFTVKSTTVDVYHSARVNGVWQESWAYGLPRLYTGDFNRLRAGTDVNCKLLNSSYTCDPSWKNGKKLCERTVEDGCNGTGFVYHQAKYVSIDDVALYGGTGNAEPGACCRTDGTCLEVSDVDTCERVLGGRFTVNALCSEILCCPYPFADADHDGAVDQNDFGAFQVCYTGWPTGGVPVGCECFDRDHSGGINTTDLTAFMDCLTGPSVPWSTGLTPTCIP